MLKARRLVLGFAGLLVLGLVVLSTRLAWIQLVDHRPSAERQQAMSVRRVSVPARRGDLLDRHGRPLALAVQGLSVEVLPRNVLGRRETSGERAELVRDIARFVAPHVQADPEDLAIALTDRRWSRLGEVVLDPDSIEALERRSRELLYGVDLVPVPERVYPWGPVAGNLVGYVDHTGHGVAGLEQGLDRRLAGQDGWRLRRVDPRGRELHDGSLEGQPPRDGQDVRLTLDVQVQRALQEECLATLEERSARRVSAVALDPRTGQVLGLASVPTVDPSDGSDRALFPTTLAPVQEVYAPGSTLKPLMLAGALQLGLVRRGELIDTSRDQGRFGGRRVKDTHPVEGQQSLEEIIVNSSNIGMARLLTRIVPEDTPRDQEAMAPVRQLLLDLGFGTTTGAPLPAEAAGLVTALGSWHRHYTLVSVSFGQELAVTPLQMAAALATLADGRYRRPRLLADAARDADGPRRVFDRDVVEDLRAWMARSVAEGSCAEVQLPGIAVAGKTGTADSEVNKGQEIHSYAALVPAQDPELALVVVVDEPVGVRFASQSAAPAAGRILRRVLPYLGHPLE